MLHTGILPHHTRWQRLFENLRYVVLDELHTYRGVFGSHLANVLRRLRRIARFYGSNPQFICSSATIANPGELASRLVETDFEVIEENGAPAGEKFFIFYNPPVVNRFLGIRRSYINEASRVAQEFLKRNLQTIVFANSRLNTEVLLTYLQQANPAQPGQPPAIRGYRGGYLPGERREIEHGLREGRIRGVVSTNALELGIDVGSLDATIMAGYAGTIASTWQRAGRAGRRSGSSCAVLVASSAPLDQFIVQHPDYFFGRSPEHAFVQPDNLEILVNHLKCAAFELPIATGETFGSVDVPDLCDRLAEAGFLHRTGEHWHWTQEAYPADTVSLRSVTSDNFVIVNITEGAEVIGEVDFSSALTTVHPKAIYLHQGQQFHVEALNFEERKAYVKRVDVDYYTDAIRYTQVRVLECAAGERIEAGGADAQAARSHGDVLVRSQVIGFKKIKFFTNENVGDGKARAAGKRNAHDGFLADPRAPACGIASLFHQRPPERHVRPAPRPGIHRHPATDVRCARPRHIDWRAPSISRFGDRMGRGSEPGSYCRACGKRILRAQSISLRRVSRRNRIFRAAVPGAQHPANKNARADRRMPLRKRLPIVRRPRRRARRARQRRRHWQSSPVSAHK